MDEKKLIEAIEHYTGKKYTPSQKTDKELRQEMISCVEFMQKGIQSDKTEDLFLPTEEF